MFQQDYLNIKPPHNIVIVGLESQKLCIIVSSFRDISEKTTVIIKLLPN